MKYQSVCGRGDRTGNRDVRKRLGEIVQREASRFNDRAPVVRTSSPPPDRNRLRFVIDSDFLEALKRDLILLAVRGGVLMGDAFRARTPSRNSSRPRELLQLKPGEST